MTDATIDNGILVKEYEVVTVRLNTLDTWAQQFVSVYFAFNVGLA